MLKFPTRMPIRMTFQDELRQLLARHGMTVDERYVWS
jgi:hypothetical protein